MDHVQNLFNDLDVQALGLADSALSHIAKTTFCSGTETCRILRRTLQKANIPHTQVDSLPEPPKAALNPRKKRRVRLLAAAGAAIATAMIGAIGVSGRLLYNKPFTERTLGLLGTARLEELDLPDPVTYTNGIVNATVDAALFDGYNAFVLLTFEATDPEQKIDWKKELHGWEPECSSPDCGFPACVEEMSMPVVVGDQCWVRMILRKISDAPSVTLTLHQNELDMPDPELIEQYEGDPSDLYPDPALLNDPDPVRNRYTDGLSIEIPLTVNTPVLTLTADDGSGYTIYLSGFEMYTRDPVFDCEGTLELKAFKNDGTEMNLFAPVYSSHIFSSPESGGEYSYAKLYEMIDGKHRKPRDPSGYNGFFDISGITGFELNGTRYSPAANPDPSSDFPADIADLTQNAHNPAL